MSDIIDLEQYENKIYSQNGEDGITEKLIDLLYGDGKYNKYYVEFGVQDGTECNTRILREKYNWTGLLMDGGHQIDEINLKQEFITKNNIIDLFSKHSVRKEIFLLSVDTDFNDFYFIYELLKNNYSADIIICEYNASIPPNEDKVVINNDDYMWDYSNYFGASLLAYKNLFETFNYSLVYCNKNGVNAFFVNNVLINIHRLNFLNIGNVDKIYRPPAYTPNGGHPADSLNRQYISSKDIIESDIENIVTYSTRYGLVSLYKNEAFIGLDFKYGNYWDLATLLLLEQYIDRYKNILEIGAHCGTSSLIYSLFIDDECKCYCYEPQGNMFKLLVHNVKQNKLENKIIPYNKGVFCYSGEGFMHDKDTDCSGGNVLQRYTDENNLICNFGGISLGTDGEKIQLTTIDEMVHENIGFIHCDAQGAESFIFSKAVETLKKFRPVILFENNKEESKELFDNICDKYPDYSTEKDFDLIDFCVNELGYSTVIRNFNNSIDALLIP